MEAKAVKNAFSLLQFSGHSELETGLLPGKYNMSAGNQTARAFFWFYSVIFIYFPLKVAEG